MATVTTNDARAAATPPGETRVVLINQRPGLAEAIAASWEHASGCELASPQRLEDPTCLRDVDTAVWLPPCPGQEGTPSDAADVLANLRLGGVKRLILVASAEVYGAHYGNSGRISEKDEVVRKRVSPIAEYWAEIEARATDYFDNDECELVILRCCTTITPEAMDVINRLLRSRLALPLAGYDPNVQLLTTSELCGGIEAALEAEPGVYNLAPDKPIPLRQALRRCGRWSLPIPYLVLRAVTWLFAKVRRRVYDIDALEFVRYSWCVSNEKLTRNTDFRCRLTSAAAIDATAPRARSAARSRPSDYDEFGVDEEYIRSCGRWQIGFMEKVYWRVEVSGLEHVPENGGGVMVGIHRGFMPFDGIIIVQIMSRETGRMPRFLIHPSLVKFSHLGGFITRHGGLLASQENADFLLEREDIVAVFPEGIRGAFKKYDNDLYRMGRLREDYARLAIRHRVPIIPFVTVGPAEIFPILAKIDWPWWKQFTHWPCFPITLTWPLIPAPLPTKWHIRFLEPIDPLEFTDDADDRKAVRALSEHVRQKMQAAIDEMVQRRRSWFFGSIFDREPPRPVDHDQPLEAV